MEAARRDLRQRREVNEFHVLYIVIESATVDTAKNAEISHNLSTLKMWFFSIDRSTAIARGLRTMSCEPVFVVV